MVCFDRSRYHKAEGAPTASTESSKDVSVLTCISCNDFTRRKHNFVFKDLVCCQAEGVACCAVDAALQVASNGPDSLE